MKLSKEDVDYTAKLAMLSFDDSEAEKLAADMSVILDYAHMLDEIDITGVEPLTHILESENVVSEDKAAVTMSIDDALANAADSEGRFFRIPKML